MSRKSTRQFDVSELGQIPVNLNCDTDNGSFISIRPDETGSRSTDLLKNLNPAIRRFWDPNYKIPSYAIQKQKVVTLTETQLEALKNGELAVYAISKRCCWLFGRRRRLLRSLRSKEASGRIVVSDCPNPPDEHSKETTFTVLLEWTETTANRFPAVELRDANGQLVHLVSDPTNNFLVISGTDPNNKPGPPIAASTSSLNPQPTDFKVLTPDDVKHYRDLAERRKLDGPTVAVVDTGIKFNLTNAEDAEQSNPYVYNDATNQRREFVLAYQQPAYPDCAAMQENRIGYCSINAYKQQSFADQLGCQIPDIRNSPFDDHRFFGDSRFTNYMDGRHGTSIAAIIQQRANVPILPVKAFDNLGFSTLFDVLNALNYVLNQREPGKIYIINASWIFGRNEPLLEHKIKQLMQAGIFVIAAAGNHNQTKDRNLEHIPVYPACYSEDYPNVITVTSVARALDDEQHPRVRLDETRLTITIPVLEKLVAIENFSKKFVNVGVLSTLGHFPSPFWQSPPLCGSSFACAYVSARLAERLRTPPAWLSAGNGITDTQMWQEREDFLKAVCEVDAQLGEEAVLGGYYLTVEPIIQKNDLT